MFEKLRFCRRSQLEVLSDPKPLEKYKKASTLIWSGKSLGGKRWAFNNISWKSKREAVLDTGEKVEVTDYLQCPTDLLRYHQVPSELFSFLETRTRVCERGKLFSFFSQVADLSQKQIYVSKYRGDLGKDVLLFRCEPGLTIQARFKRMQKLVAQTVSILSRNEGISQLWLHGSLARGEPLAKDIDLIVVVDSGRNSLFLNLGDFKGKWVDIYRLVHNDSCHQERKRK